LLSNGRLQRLALHLRTVAPDKLDASLDLLDLGWFNPGLMAIPCVNLNLAGTKLTCEFVNLYASYSGKLSPDRSALIGAWNTGQSVPAGSRDLYGSQQSLRLQKAGTGKAPPAISAAAPPIALADLKPVLDREFAPIVEHGLLSKATGGGLVIGVSDHGQRRIFCFGAAKADSIFEIDSVTKTFTALALAQLVEQKKATLEEPVRALLPAGTVAKPDGPEITLLDLATQHSGLPRMPSNFEFANVATLFGHYSVPLLNKFLATHGVAKPASATFLYSNTGFGLLGYALAQRAGLSYEQLIKTEITGPLHMDDTVVTLSPAQRKRLIQGYNAAFEPVPTWNYSDALAGAGALRSTASDLLTYLEANLRPKQLALGASAGLPSATLPAALVLQHQPRASAILGTKIAMAWFFNEQANVYFHDG
jgi:serine-type D-Ala-D-Ala carboxypeptidase/endopeptidase